MAYRTWGAVLLSALGVGSLAGAGQLGFAYGLGLVRFPRTFDGATENHWPAQVTWVTWFAVMAAVAGTVAAQRIARRYELSTSTGSRIGIAAVAGLGAAAVAPLSMLPARLAEVDAVNPVAVTGLSAALGAVVGAAAGFAVLSQRVIGWNVAALTGAAWLLILISVGPSLGPTDPLPDIRLGVLDPAWLSTGTGQRLAVITMPALALVTGAAVGAFARWRGHQVIPAAASGTVGPALLAFAYLTAGPGGSVDRYQTAPYWAALLSIAAGALGSVLAVLTRLPSRTTAPTAIGDEPVTGRSGAAGIWGRLSRRTPVGPTAETPDADTTPTGTAEAGQPDPAAPSDVPAPVAVPEPAAPELATPEPARHHAVAAATEKEQPADDHRSANSRYDSPYGDPLTDPLPLVQSSLRLHRSTPQSPWRPDEAPTSTPEPPRVPAPRAEPPRVESTRAEPTVAPARPAAPNPVPPRAAPNPVPPQAGPSPLEQVATPTPERRPASLADAGRPPAEPARPTFGTSLIDRVEASSDESTPAPAESSPASTDGPAARPRRGLFRRNRSAAVAEPAAATTEPTSGEPPATVSEPVEEPKGKAKRRPRKGRDDEYVDWVSGLSGPAPAAEQPSRDPGPRRSLRTSGRHQGD